MKHYVDASAMLQAEEDSLAGVKGDVFLVGAGVVLLLFSVSFVLIRSPLKSALSMPRT